MVIFEQINISKILMFPVILNHTAQQVLNILTDVIFKFN
jgi:hypothetical protein